MENKHINISEKNIRRFCREMRKVIYLYYLFEFTVEEFSDEDTHKYYSVDESYFNKSRMGEQIWILEIMNNDTKNFRIVASKTRDGVTLKAFITCFIKRGNYIVSDGRYDY